MGSGAPRSEQRLEFRRVLFKAGAALAASVPSKLGEAKAVAFQTLMERVQQAQPRAEWVPALQSEFIKSYPTLEARWQRQLLSFYASALRSRRSEEHTSEL